MFSLKEEKKWVKIFLITIAVIFFILQLYLILYKGDFFYLGSLEKADNDDVKYIRSAWNFINNGYLSYNFPGKPTAFIMPGHVLILSGFMKIFGYFGGITAFRIFQALLQVMSLYLIFFISRHIFNTYTAAAAVLLNVLYIPEYQTSSLILTECIFKFLFLLLIYISIYALRKKKAGYYIAGGFVYGLTCLVRPTAAAYPVIVLFAWILSCSGKLKEYIPKYNLIEMLKYSFIVLLIFSCVMLPWWFRNYSVFNKFIPFTVSSGNPFLQGTYINYDQSKDYLGYEPVGDEIIDNRIEMETGKLRLKSYFKSEPLKYIYWYTVGKTIKLYEYPFYLREAFNVSFASALIYHKIILFLSFFGLILGILNKNNKIIILLLSIVYSTLIYLPYFTYSRYLYPVMPIIICFSGYAVLEIVYYLKSYRTLLNK